MRDIFMNSKRLGFSKWNNDDLPLAIQLWGNEAVTHFICASGKFSNREIMDRLKTEITNDEQYNIQYWPLFELSTGKFIGCCGLRPFSSENNTYEIGFHLCEEFWGMGYATEAIKAVIQYSFHTLKANKLYAGHHPENKNSKKLLTKLKFQYIAENYYEPTGLYHPSYQLLNQSLHV